MPAQVARSVRAIVAAIFAAFVLGTRSQGPEPLEATPTPASPEIHGNVAQTGEDQTDDGTDQTDAEGNPSGGTGALPDALALNAPPPASDSPPLVEAVSVAEAATVLEHAERRYAVGATGDFVETGDWDCDGQPTAAIVRPSTGGVVLFDAWPGPGETISLPARWSVDSPTGAEAVAHGDCDLLRVYTTAGSRLFNPAKPHDSAILHVWARRHDSLPADLGRGASGLTGLKHARGLGEHLPHTISDIGPAPATSFRISDIDPAPTPGYDATDHSDHAPDAPADLFKISDASSR